MKNRLIYVGVGCVTILAMFVFVHTLVQATVYDTSTYAPPAPVADADSTATSSPAVSSSPTTSNAQVKLASAAVTHPPYYPERLVIPSIGVNAFVQDVGITARGTLGTPNNFTDVAWYSAGTVPGQVGSAIIDGHVNNGLGLSGVFVNLADIHVGDDIYITSYGGTQLHFSVTKIAWYDYENAPTDQIFNENDGTFLKLITCEGTWVPGQRTYNERIVVTAQLATS